VSSTFELANYQPPGGPLGNYLATQPINAGSTSITGLETAYLQHLTFLPGAWGGFVLSANFGYTASRTSGIPGRSDHPRSLRMSPRAFNISPTYDHSPVSIRVGLSYNHASIYSFQYANGLLGGVNGPPSDIYFYSHFQIDAQASGRLAQRLSFLMYVLNLNNEVFGFCQGSPQYMIQQEHYLPTVAARHLPACKGTSGSRSPAEARQRVRKDRSCQTASARIRCWPELVHRLRRSCR
jgi:hypothetical protein